MEINGLPLHPLVVHAAVVFAPVAALVALVYAAVPRWRDRLRWPMLGLAVVAALSVVAAYLSGNDFLESRPGLEELPAVETHEERAEVALWVTLGFAGLAGVAAWVHTRPGIARTLARVALGIASVAALVAVVMAGDAGARAVWGS